MVTENSRPYVIEHGWCEVKGAVVDPTHAPHISPDDPPKTYFAGMRFSVRDAEAAVLRGRLPIAWSRETRDYWHAFEAAWRYATQQADLGPSAPTRVVHCRRAPFDEFIGRPSTWANPYHIGPDGNRHEVARKYSRWLVRHPALLRSVWSLRGKALGCRCVPMLCHGDVLADLANISLPDVSATPGILDRWLIDHR